MKLIKYLEKIALFEGGGLGKKYGAESIYKNNIESTVIYFLEKFKQYTGININIDSVKILGSAGKKDYSGDIDISIPKEISRQLVQYLINELYNNKKKDFFLNNIEKKYPGIEENKKNAIAALNFGKSVGSPFNFDKEQHGIKLLTTINDFDFEDGMPGLIPFVVDQIDSNGKFLNKRVQLDLNFGDNDWMSFAYFYEPEESPDNRPIKGLHRNAILASLIHFLGGEWGFQKGFKKSKKDSSFNEQKTDLIAFINDKIKLNIEEKDLNSYSSILKIVKQLDKNKRKKIFDIMIKRLHGPLMPSPDLIYIPTEKDFNL